MATLTVSSGDFIRPYKGRGKIKWFPVAASQTILVGTPVQLSTTSDKGNEIKKSAADPTTDRGLVGFAAEAITTGASVSATTDRIPVWVASGENEFIVRAQDTGTLDNDDISVEYGIVEDSTNGIWRLDRSETSAKVFRVLELLDAHGDVNGRYVAMVIAPERLYHD